MLRIAAGEDISTLNPHLTDQTIIGAMSALTQAWLLRTVDGRPSPELATAVPTQSNGGVSRDGKTITYHLRKGAVWSDGVPFTAADVVFSTKVVLNPANNEVSRHGWDDISRIDEPNPYIVVYHLKHPYGGFVYQYFSTAGANPSILPKHLLGGLPNINRATYNALPVGIGPFKYVRWKRGEYVEMAANPTYFRGPPRLRRIVFTFFLERNSALDALLSHEIDMWSPPAAYYERARRIPGVTVMAAPGNGFSHIDFNLKNPVLADPSVRQALRLAIDRKTLNRKIGDDLGVVQDGVISPANPSFDPHVPTAPFDISEANRRLDDAGWRRGADGVRRKGAQRLSLVFASPIGMPDYDQRIELIRVWLKEVGVEIDVKRYAAPLMFAPAADGGIINGGRFDLVSFISGLDPSGDVFTLYACSQFPPNGQNDTRYCNHKVDAAMERFAQLYSVRDRKPYADFIQEQLQRDVPTIVLNIPDVTFAYNSDLKSFVPNNGDPFDCFMDVDI